MTATPQQIEIGAQALKNFVASIDGWEANFVPWGTYENGAQLIINKYDSVGPATNSDAEDLKRAECGLTLYKTISDAGYGSDVTPEQCEQAALAVLAAAGRIKSRQTS